MGKRDIALTWVVVADNCQAKIYRLTKFPKIEEISYVERPESRLHNQDLVSQKPGTKFARGGNVAFSYAPEVNRKQIEADHFASDLSAIISSAHQKGDFNRLYIIAAPAFLGLLRKHLSNGVHKTIIAELPKELTAFDVTQIEHHIALM